MPQLVILTVVGAGGGGGAYDGLSVIKEKVELKHQH